MSDEKIKKVGYKIGYASGVAIFLCFVVILVALTAKTVMMIFGGM